MMKFNALSVVLLLICIGLIIYIWNPGGIFTGETDITTETVARAEQPTFERSGLWFPPQNQWIDPEEKARVEAYIVTIETQLNSMSGTLNANSIDEIKEFFKHRGFITTYDGEKIRANSIHGYLTSHLAKIESIDFKLRWFVAEENTYNAENILPGQEDDNDVLSYVQFGLKLTYVMTDGREIDPPGSRDDRHIRSCDWIGN